MFDTRAAIRELRLLSEKRSASTLTEAEQGRWVALRRQLGLPLEVAVDAGAQAEPAPAPEPEPDASSPPAAAAPSQPEVPWSGPSLDTAASHPAEAGWKGPGLEVPAWADGLSERATDPSLEQPPPAPFDDAPAARPPHVTEVADLTGQADERVPLAPAAEFISYAREGAALDLPPEPTPSEDFAGRGLAELANPPAEAAPLPAPVPEPPAAPEPDLPPAEVSEALPPAEEPPAPPLEAVPEPEPPARPPANEFPSALAAEAAPEPPAPPLDVPESIVPAPVDAGLSAQPVSLDVAREPFPAPEATALDEGVIPLTPAPFPAEAPLPPVPPQDGSYQARALIADVVEVVETPPAHPLHAPSSTWAPGAVAPPVLAPDEFGRSFEALSTDGLDPWPEAPLPEAPAAEPPPPETLLAEAPPPDAAPLPEAPLSQRPTEPEAPGEDEAVETVGDEDLIHEAVTPTPLPIPPPPPPGSGGIRGFQFPRPPGPMVIPVPPTSPSLPRTRTAPSQPAAPVPLTSAPRAPAPIRLDTPFPSVPRPSAADAASPAPRAAPSGVPLRTPLPAAAVAPVTPRPAAPLRVATPPPAPPAPAVAPPAPRAAPPGILLRTPVPATARAPATPGPAAPLRVATPLPTARTTPPPVLAPAPVPEDEHALPLLELVDEVAPAPVAAAERCPAPPPAVVPTLAAGTGVFGPPMILNPGFVEGVHRVVVHTLEGQVHRGTVHDLDLQDEALLVAQGDGREIRIPARRVKAVFFVLAPGESPPRPRGERVQVTFRDGRQVVGHSEDHASGEPGFFVVPSDARTNTSRVYVFRGGIQSITAG